MDAVPPYNVFNYDETNLSDDPGKSRLIFRRGVKYPERVINFSKSAKSIMMCGSADGTLLPPYIVYKSECLWDTWCKSGPKGTPCCTKICCSQGSRYARTKHGWFDAQTFHDWFILTFLPHAKRLPGCKVLIGDNLSSHINIEVIKACEENDIAFVCLPANVTHLCQPLDVCFFRAMKAAWRKQLLEWKQKYPRCGILPKEIFPSLLNKTLLEMNGSSCTKISEHLISGFKAAGIIPLNKDKVLSKLLPVQDESAVGQEINDSLTKFLRSQRTLLEPTIRRKRSSVNVEPGRSIIAPRESSSSDTDEDIPVDNSTTEEESSNDNESLEDEYDTFSLTNGKSVQAGRFVLVKFSSSSRKSYEYRYVCKVLKINDKSGDLEVMGFKSQDNKCVFKAVIDDVSIVNVNEVIQMLPEPIFCADGDKDVITFKKDIDVKELS